MVTASPLPIPGQKQPRVDRVEVGRPNLARLCVVVVVVFIDCQMQPIQHEVGADLPRPGSKPHVAESGAGKGRVPLQLNAIPCRSLGSGSLWDDLKLNNLAHDLH